jgi:hypothetical protein
LADDYRDGLEYARATFVVPTISENAADHSEFLYIASQARRLCELRLRRDWLRMALRPSYDFSVVG